MRSYLVPLPSYYEEQMLHHLPHLQLGSPYDVYAYDVYVLLLLHLAFNIRWDRIHYMGDVRFHLSGALLGAL